MVGVPDQDHKEYLCRCQQVQGKMRQTSREGVVTSRSKVTGSCGCNHSASRYRSEPIHNSTARQFQQTINQHLAHRNAYLQGLVESEKKNKDIILNQCLKMAQKISNSPDTGDLRANFRLND
eukprot:768174-Hanusia_phi.AAC.2